MVQEMNLSPFFSQIPSKDLSTTTWLRNLSLNSSLGRQSWLLCTEERKDIHIGS